MPKYRYVVSIPSVGTTIVSFEGEIEGLNICEATLFMAEDVDKRSYSRLEEATEIKIEKITE